MTGVVPQRGSLLWLASALGFAGALHVVPAFADYFLMRWPAFGIGGAVFLCLMLLAAPRSAGQVDRVARLNWMLLIIYLVHQFEEHGIDLYGEVYAFIDYANALLAARAGGIAAVQMTPLDIYRVNTLAVWLPFLLAVWGGRRYVWPGLAAAGLVLTNGLLHISMALALSAYNPGLATSIVLFLPLSVFYFRAIKQECGLPRRAIAFGVLFGVGAHAMLPLLFAGVLPADVRAVVLMSLLVLAGLAPLAANAIYSRAVRS